MARGVKKPLPRPPRPAGRGESGARRGRARAGR
jgi:hypothetical protein